MFTHEHAGAARGGQGKGLRAGAAFGGRAATSGARSGPVQDALECGWCLAGLRAARRRPGRTVHGAQEGDMTCSSAPGGEPHVFQASTGLATEAASAGWAGQGEGAGKTTKHGRGVGDKECGCTAWLCLLACRTDALR